MSNLNLIPVSPTLWGPWPAERWLEPSRVLVASDGRGNGCVLATEGPHFLYEIEEAGASALNDLWLDDLDHGIWVVIGSVEYTKSQDTPNGPCEVDCDFEIVECRRPNPEEWIEIIAGRSPWLDPLWDEFVSIKHDKDLEALETKRY